MRGLKMPSPGERMVIRGRVLHTPLPLVESYEATIQRDDKSKVVLLIDGDIPQCLNQADNEVCVELELIDVEMRGFVIKAWEPGKGKKKRRLEATATKSKE